MSQAAARVNDVAYVRGFNHGRFFVAGPVFGQSSGGVDIVVLCSTGVTTEKYWSGSF